MGASGWSYFVPYQPDFNMALKELKDEIFTKGQFEQPFNFDPNETEKNLEFLESVYKDLPKEIRKHSDLMIKSARGVIKKQQPKRVAKSIKDLIKQCGEEGTHSILDIEKVATEPGLRIITPMPKKKLIELFGTEQPTHDVVEKWSTRIDPPHTKPLYERWGGIYIIIYKNSQPIEIYFEGASGD